MKVFPELQKIRKKTQKSGKVKSRPLVNDMLSMMSTQASSNNLKAFKKYVEADKERFSEISNAIQYKYNIDLNIYNNEANSDSYVKSSPNQIMNNIGMGDMQQMETMYGGAMASHEIWEEMLDNQELLESQYDMIAGKWPSKFNEVVLIVDQNNRISDYTLYSIGLLDPDELTNNYKSLINGGKVENIDEKVYTFNELLNLKFKLVINTDYYIKDGNTWKDMQEDEAFMKNLLNNAQDINVVRNH